VTKIKNVKNVFCIYATYSSLRVNKTILLWSSCRVYALVCTSCQVSRCWQNTAHSVQKFVSCLYRRVHFGIDSVENLVANRRNRFINTVKQTNQWQNNIASSLLDRSAGAARPTSSLHRMAVSVTSEDFVCVNIALIGLPCFFIARV